MEKLTLPDLVSTALQRFVTDSQNAFGANLVSVVLFGSGAEGRLRTTSDVNVVVVLKSFDIAQADAIRDRLRVERAAVRLTAMFLLEEELVPASEAFAMKFGDIVNRHSVLFGEDPFAKLEIPRASKIRRLQQVLLNLSLRFRERYLATSLREEQLALAIAEFAGPLRVAAATLLDLRGNGEHAPKEALQKIASELAPPDWETALTHLSRAREERMLPAGAARPTATAMLALLDGMRKSTMGLK